MIKYYPTKSAAKKAIIALGYTIHYLTGESGDYAHGSREYFKKPTAKLNEFGMPIGDHGTISKVPAAGWAISLF